MLTKAKLKEMDPCVDMFKWWCAHCEGLSTVDQILELMSDVSSDKAWANWLLVRVMNQKQRLAYVIFAAEQVLHLFKKEYPKDKRLREVIEAAKVILARGDDASVAYAYAYAVAYAVYAYADAYAVAYAYAVADAVAYATAVADADADDASVAYAAYAVADAVAYAAEKSGVTLLIILEYGISLLERRDK